MSLGNVYHVSVLIDFLLSYDLHQALYYMLNLDIVFLALDCLGNAYLRDVLLKLLCPLSSILPNQYYELLWEYLQSERFFVEVSKKILNDKNVNGV